MIEHTDGQKLTHLDSGGSIGGILGTTQNFMVPTNLVHIVIGPGRGTWDQTNKNLWGIEKFNIPVSFGTTNQFVRKSTKTKMTALARSVNLERGWTTCYRKIN